MKIASVDSVLASKIAIMRKIENRVF